MGSRTLGKQTYRPGILAERVTLAQDSPDGKTNQTADGQSTDKAETRDGSSNVDVLPPAFQSGVMFQRCGGDDGKRRDVSIRPTEGKEDQHEHPIR